jgi:hypothetical protein
MGFAAVVWQSGIQAGFNFGVDPGVVLPAGAVEASFWAKGAVGGEMVTFAVGSTGTGPCTDSVVASPTAVTLTAAWKKYTIPFPPAVTYTAGQVDGFSWVVAGAATDSTVSFFVDNIQWDAN